jgi:hypothetical protein
VATVGVQRQDTGTAGRFENAQVAGGGGYTGGFRASLLVLVLLEVALAGLIQLLPRSDRA